MRTWRGIRVILVVIAALTAVLSSLGLASANGKPVRVTLSYVEGVSNWGPKDALASGIVAVADAEVTLDVAGLPPQKDDTYHVWLVESEGGRYVSIGTFDTRANGRASFHQVIEDLPSGPYSMIVITVEPRAKTELTPDGRRSIVGQIPHGKPPALPTALPTPSPLPGAPTVVPSSTVGPMTDSVGEPASTGTVAFLPTTGGRGTHLTAHRLETFAFLAGLAMCLMGGVLKLRQSKRVSDEVSK